MSSGLLRLAACLALAVAYVGLALAGLSLTVQAPQVTAVWAPTGLALACVLRLGAPAVPAVLLGAFVANALADEPWLVAAGIAVGNTLEAVVGAVLLRRVGFDDRLARVRDVMALLAAAAVSPLLSATLGVTSLVAGGVQPVAKAASLWWLWWLGDALGAIVVAPVLLAWTSEQPLPRRRLARVEALVLLAALVAVGSKTLAQPAPGPFTEYSLFPFLIWAALRLGPASTVSVTFAADAFAAWATYRGYGPFAGAGPEQGLVHLQVFVGVAAVTGLLLGAVAAQHRQARESLALNERRLLLALEAGRMGAFDWDIASGRVAWSEGLEPMHGLRRGGFGGSFEAFSALIHPDDAARVNAAIAKAVQERVPYEAQFRIRGPDGVERWIDARGQVLEDGAGRAVRMVGLCMDVSRAKQLEEELRQGAAQLAAADARKDEFLAMLAHELRNPLAPIRTAVDLLEQGDPEAARRAREIIRRQSAHLTRLVDDLLDVARITRNAIRIERRRVALQEVIAAGVETCSGLIAARRQQLEVDVPEQPLLADVDPTRFAQVISNLLHNAAKFTPRGGQLRLLAAEDDGWITLRVRDNGAGIGADSIDSIFELFVQGARPLDRPHGGLGLGLTLVRRLVELHGGSVRATSAGRGQGSEFIVRVPRAAGPELEAPAPKPGAVAAPPPQRRILVVEDNADARESLVLALALEGHQVQGAADGRSAAETARGFAPEVVVLDIGLPGEDGYAVARALRRLPQCAGAKLIALSGYGQQEDRERSRAAGFDHHLLKPAGLEQLRELLRPDQPA